MPVPVLILDARGRIEYANRIVCDFLCLEGDPAGRRPAFLLRGMPKGVRRAAVRALARGERWSGAVEVSGHRLAVTAAPVEGVPGGAAGSRLLCVATDVTREADLEDRLQRAQRLESLGRLATGMVHDINNILTIIETTATFAQKATEDRPELHQDLTEIRDAVRSAAQLSRQILSFSRRGEEGLTRIDVNPFVRRVLHLFRRLVGDAIRLETSLGLDLPRVFADEGQLEQVVANLVVNARDAVPPTGGRITLSTCLRSVERADIPTGFAEAGPGPHVVLGVRDNGTGMDRRTLEKVFEPFFTTKDPDHGTGLGLATVRSLVIRNRGFLTVSSAPGIGTEFLVHLPVRREEPPPAGGGPAG